MYVFSHFVSPKYKVRSPSRDEHIPRDYKATTKRTFDKLRVFHSARSRFALRNVLNPRMQFPRRISFSGRETHLPNLVPVMTPVYGVALLSPAFQKNLQSR